MALAIVLILVVAGAAAFHFLSPWWFTPIASNWGLLDDTILITLVITGVLFVVINVFIAWAVVRYRHREGHKAAYEPENKKLEGWLTVVTGVGIVVMLAPGLYVYSEMIGPPEDAAVVEVVGRQWQWHYRFPGEDGRLGLSDVRYVSGNNPLGVNPDDPAGRDDIVVTGPELQLPVGKPVVILVRSHDVLHNFYVPQFRAKSDLVPGQVSRFWLTPTQTGRYEAMCAELCGVGHYNMRGHVVVAEEADFRTWLAGQPTFALALAGPEGNGAGAVGDGRSLAQGRGCLACHSTDGSPSVGPTWQGLFGRERPLADGRTVLADEHYLTKSIREPNADVAQGFPAVMPPVPLNDAETVALVDYIKTLAGPVQGR